MQESTLENASIGHSQRSNPNVLRTIAALLAFLPIALLATASQLTPSPIGLGTHQQLGLPPCTMRALAGIACPGCGMTTSWAHFMNGEWKQSMNANLGGFMLAIYSLAFTLFAAKSAVMGQLPHQNTQRNLAVVLLAIAAVTLSTWGWSLLP